MHQVEEYHSQLNNFVYLSLVLHYNEYPLPLGEDVFMGDIPIAPFDGY